ncbi:MAG: hypothetical protein HN975_01990 [Anaerolineae bacterium]|mgnify:CR=1 FL=1|jgi:hypothetical protein|nr:hypothetical protein [Anaerolineae bacterium]
MQLKYGSYTHANGEVGLNISRDVIFTTDGFPSSIRETWVIEGKLLPTESQSVNSLIAGLSSAYSYDGYDLGLYDNGARTNLYLLSNDCISGTQVTQHPSFPTSQGAALVTNLPYKIMVRGDRPSDVANRWVNNGVELVSWQETLTRMGGGPLSGHIETLYTRPVPQQFRRHTIYYLTQAGSAVGRYDYPNFPRPIWPGAMTEAPSEVRISPSRLPGGGYENYTIQWQYRFESSVPLLGGPTLG